MLNGDVIFDQPTGAEENELELYAEPIFNEGVSCDLPDGK